MPRRSIRPWLWALLAVVVVLLGLRAALPYWLTDHVNERIQTMGDYRGHVEEVDLHLWRGAYSVRKLNIWKRTGEIPVPLLNAPEVEFSVSWRALLDGKIVAKAQFYRPEINFVHGDPEGTQAGLGVDWRQQLESLAPFRIDEMQIHDGAVWFRNYTSDPLVDIQASEVQGVALNLTNVGDDAERAAQFYLTARLLGHAPLESQGRFDPFNVLEDFQYSLKVTEFDLPLANEFLRAYAKLDVTKGVGDFVMELESQDGRLEGYAKPLFRDVEIFSWEQEVEQQGENPLRIAWEAVAGFLQNLFKNQEMDQIATRVEISGTIDNTEASTLQAIAGVLRNAFVDAFRPQFEDLPDNEPSGE